MDSPKDRSLWYLQLGDQCHYLEIDRLPFAKEATMFLQPIRAGGEWLLSVFLTHTKRSFGGLLLLLALTAGCAHPSLVRERATLKGHTLALAALAYSSDGKFLATASYDRTAKVWDTTTNKELVTVEGHTATVEAVSFSPDGKKLVTGSYDGTVKLWDWAAGKEFATFKGHTNMIRSLAYSPDGQTIASGSHDNTIKLWDVATAKERATLKHNGAVRSLAFSHDG